MTDFDGRTSAVETTFVFHGSYTRAVDGKGRFNLPFRFRNAGGLGAAESYIVAEGPDGTLTLLPYTEWLRAFQKMRQQRPGKTLRAELRRLSHHSRVVEPDAQGRVMVAPEFLARVGVEKKVLVLGVGHYLELWDPERFAEYQATQPEADEEFMDAFFG